jgi:cytoskeletal protein RodZ
MDENGESGSLGSWLQSARESRGESLDDVARVTRIGKGYLEAIELGEMHKLPSEAYAKGFVRLYATHLGLSGDEAVARLQGGQVAPSVEQQNSLSVDVTSAESPVRGVGTRYQRWAIPLTLLFFLLVFATFSRLKRDNAVPVAAVPTEKQPPVPATEQLSPAAVPVGPVQPGAPPIAAEPTTPPAESAPTDGIILRLKAVQTGKLHITIDGAVSQEYDLNVGDLVEWKAEKMFLLELDNAASVEGDLNGKPLKPFGEPGKAAHLSIGVDGVRQE